MSDDQRRAEAEILDLHDFFEGWIAGTLPNDDETYAKRFVAHLAPGFRMVQPGGGLSNRKDFVEGMRGAHGANPDFRIRVDVPTITISLRRGDTLVATYTEWQKGAKASKPSNNGRRSSIVFLDDGERLLWAHLHETWLPAEEMAAGNYDF